MFTTLILGLALLGQHRAHLDLSQRRALLEPSQYSDLDRFPLPEADSDYFPMDLQLGDLLNLDEFDSVIRRQHNVVLIKKVLLDRARRLARQNAISSPAELEQAVADVRYQEALEGAWTALRALDVYEHDVSSWAIPHDEAKEYTLLLDWLKQRGAMAKAKADFWAYRLVHDRELFRRNFLSYWDWVASQIDHNEARDEVALNRAQQDWVALELAARTGQGAYDPDGQFRLKIALRQASVQHYEAMAARDKSRLDMIRVMLRSRLSLRSLIPRSYIILLRMAYDDAIESLAAERRRLVELEVEKADPDNYPLALRRSIEVDDLVRAIRRQHNVVLIKKALLDTTRRLARRDAISPAELEQAIADIRYQEAWEADVNRLPRLDRLSSRHPRLGGSV